MVVQRIVKPKNQRSKRYLNHVAPKIHENTKQAMFIKGGNTSQTVTQILKELCILKKPDAVSYKRKNILRPFDDATPIEFFSKKSDASLFLFGSHNKKRPNNLVLGRLFNYNILDMIELGVLNFKSMYDFRTDKIPACIKPCIIISGEEFEEENEYSRLKNLFIDFFRGPVVSHVRLTGLEHVITITVKNRIIYIRSYRIILKKSGSKLPRVELEEIGPSMDLEIRRTKLASDDLFKRALKKPKTAKPKKKKNVSMDPFGTKHGRIHMQKQDLNKLQTRKMKGLKKRKSEDTQEDGSDPKKSREND